MTYRSSYQPGPEATPRALKILIAATAGCTLAAAFFPAVQGLLALSLPGIRHLFLWQFITYLFVQIGSISFPFLLHLAFNMYLLWTFGASLLQRAHLGTFLGLYFGAGAFAALTAFGLMSAFSLPYALAGSSTALYALLISWVILNPDAELLLFFAIPFKAKWLLLGLIGANLLIDLSNSDWVSLASYSGSVLFGYLYTLIAFREQSPFLFLRPFERTLLRALEKLRHLGRKEKNSKQPKIYDIHSGAPQLSDDQFMDAMLARISLHGEDSLTPEEKRRMQAISTRKSARKK